MSPSKKDTIARKQQRQWKESLRNQAPKKGHKKG